MPRKKPTKYAEMLYQALCNRGVSAELEHWDGHKHVDIAILNARIYIEVDGIRHFTEPRQIDSDFKRTYYSNDDFDTFHVPNQVLKKYLDEVVDALVKVVEMRKAKLGKASAKINYDQY
jgi:very-short-patch-repair endonuclease